MNEIGRQLIKMINDEFYVCIELTKENSQYIAELVIEFMESEGYRYCKDCSGHKYRC